MIYHAVVHSI